MSLFTAWRRNIARERGARGAAGGARRCWCMFVSHVWLSEPQALVDPISASTTIVCSFINIILNESCIRHRALCPSF